MNKLFILLLFCLTANAEPTCKVQICNRIERFSLDIFSHIKDNMAETCFETVIAKSEAIQGRVLSSESRWYQGSSINPTKKSVTKIKKVISCNNT